MSAYTQDQIAAAIIAEGQTARTTGPAYLQHPVIIPKGIVIGLATGLVESDLTMYVNAANQAAADRAGIKYDKISRDANSDGVFQQRDPWWGTLAERMDPRLSAAMFFNSLNRQRVGKQDYSTDAVSPGGWAQLVQQSAFPDRYDQRIGDAQAIYNRLSGGAAVTIPAAPTEDPRLAALAKVRPDFNEYPNWSDNSQDRGGTDVDLWLNHTEEGEMNADSLVTWMKDNGVSYHYAGSQDPRDGGVTIVDMIDTDLASWSVMNSNDRAINFCYAGSYSNWSRDQWMAKAGKVIDVAAYLAVQDCIKYPKLAARVIVPYSDPPGIADHRYCSLYLKDGNNHGDVGGPQKPPWTGFPWDYFADRVKFYWNAANDTAGTPAPTPAPTPTPSPVVPSLPTGDAASRIQLEQQLGPWDDANGRFTGWPQLSGDPEALKVLQGKVDAGVPLSQVDALAAIRFNLTPSTKPKAVCAPLPKKPTAGKAKPK